MKAIRTPMHTSGRARRSLEERVVLRFPRILAPVAWVVWHQPSRRLRWAAVRRALRLAWESFNRGDYEATFLLYSPDTESLGADVWNTIGAEMETRGRDARIAYQRTVRADWDELRFESEELIRLGDDRLVSVGRMSGRGRASGATVDTPWAVLLIIEDGLVRRERIFLDPEEALEAAAASG